MAEFRAWPKTPRLFKSVLITEKLDGTNACAVIERGHPSESQDGWCAGVSVDGDFYKVGAQSRNRTITPGNDNYGFARWVADNAAGLVAALGDGYHYGEWWGKGIQRGYGMDRKVFSLFNVSRWAIEIPHDRDDSAVPGLRTVPLLAEIPEMDTEDIRAVYEALEFNGSAAAPGFMSPEGVIVYHTAAKQIFKVTDNGDQAKSAVRADEAGAA